VALGLLEGLLVDGVVGDGVLAFHGYRSG